MWMWNGMDEFDRWWLESRIDDALQAQYSHNIYEKILIADRFAKDADKYGFFFRTMLVARFCSTTTTSHHRLCFVFVFNFCVLVCVANADRRAHIIIMTMADDGWWCAYLCTYLYTVWFDDSKCTVECDDVGTFVGVVAEVDGRIQRLVSLDQYWYVIMLLFVGRFAANAHWQRRNTRTNARNCAWQYFVLFTAAADHHSYIYLFRLFSIYICFQSLQQNSVSLLALVCWIQLWSRICAVHTKINSSSALGREFETIVQRAVTKCLSTQHMHSTAYACTDRSKRHTHTQNGLYSCGYLRLPPFGMFLMFYIFLLLLFFSSCTDAR